MSRTKVTLHSIDPARNRYRRYTLEIFPHDLFGRYELIRTFGRIGRPGHTMVKVYSSREEAQKAAQELIRLRARHGYTQIED